MVTFNIQCKTCDTDKLVDMPGFSDPNLAEIHFRNEILPLLDHKIVPSAENSFMSRNRPCDGIWDIKVAFPK